MEMMKTSVLARIALAGVLLAGAHVAQACCPGWWSRGACGRRPGRGFAEGKEPSIGPGLAHL